MFYVTQHETAFSKQFGILPSYFERVFDKVGYALTWPVARAEQFEVFDPVVGLDSVDVVDGFLGEQFAPQVLFHNIPVFKNVAPNRFAVLSWNTKRDVVATYSLADLWQAVLFAVYFAGPLVFALFAAEFLFAVYGSVAFTARPVEYLTAVFAFSFVALIGVFSATCIRAGHRTVRGGMPVFLQVSAEICGFVRKRVSAFLASECYLFYSRIRATVNGFGCPQAFGRAELPSQVTLTRDAKRPLAVLAGYVVWHVYGSLFGSKGTVAHARG